MDKIRQGNFYLIDTKPEPTKVILTLVEKPERSGGYPDRRAKMCLFSFTQFGLHRLSEPVLVLDTENILPEEFNQMLGVYFPNFNVNDARGSFKNV